RMNCRECEEIIAGAGRAHAELPDAAEAHVAACPACRAFGEELVMLGRVLAGWDAPPPDPRAVAACKAALVARLAPDAPAAPRLGAKLDQLKQEAGEFLRQPALIGVLGAGAAAAGAVAAPGWVQQVAMGWAAGAALLASLVLLYHGRG